MIEIDYLGVLRLLLVSLPGEIIRGFLAARQSRLSSMSISLVPGVLVLFPHENGDVNAHVSRRLLGSAMLALSPLSFLVDVSCLVCFFMQYDEERLGKCSRSGNIAMCPDPSRSCLLSPVKLKVRVRRQM